MKKHVAMHDVEMSPKPGTASLVSLSTAEKKKITEGAVKALWEGLLPLIFAEGEYGIL